MSRLITAAAIAGLALTSPRVSTAGATAPARLWTEVERASARSGGTTLHRVQPERTRADHVELPALRELLALAPPELADLAAAPEITLPLPNGRLERFRVAQSPLLGPAFRARHPELRTFVARGIDDATIEARLDLTPRGLRAIIFTPDGVALLDPLQPGSTDALRSAWTTGGDGPFECALRGSGILPAGADPGRTQAAGDVRRTFRFILVGTGQYTAALGGVSLATAEMVTSMSRIAAIFEREAAVRLELVDLVAFPDSASDPYPSNVITDLISRNLVVVDSLFGPGSYDLAQVVGQRGGPYPSGGAFLASACTPQEKAGSAVVGPDPGANWYMLKIMAHEVGHMLGARHTQDADCVRQPETAYEPGSGTTIMSYAGKCPGYDVESWADPYFHGASIEQMVAFWTSRGGCGTAVATGNAVPVANAGADYTIPRQTPFVLAGGGFDPDPWDTLSYCWEEFDKAATSHDPVNGPLVRSRPPSSSPSRAFPATATVLSGTVDPYEALPAVDRALRFRLTVRDNHAGTGGHAWDETMITVSGPPFAVTSPNGGETKASDEIFPVTWTVGGGSVAPTVDILLSPDGGANWTLLAANVPNDGDQPVSWHAAVTSTACRIRVAAVGNVFYDVSDADFAITGTTTGVPPLPATSAQFVLMPPTPSPSRGAITVEFQLARPARLDLAVYSLQGKRLRVLSSAAWPTGHYRLVWDGRDDAGRRLPNGAYFIRGAAHGHAVQQRAWLLR